MPETDKSSKTEEPTPKRKSEAMAKGQFARTPEIGVVFSLIAGWVVLLFLAKDQAEQLSMLSAHIFSHLGELSITQESISHWAKSGLGSLFGLAYPLLLLSFLAAIMAGGLQSGFRLTPKVLELKLDRLDPIAGFKRIMGMQALVQFGIDLLKFMAIGYIVYQFIVEIMNDPIFFTPVPIGHLGVFILKASLMMLVRLIGALAIIALINHVYQLQKTHSDMKMTRQEVKDEMKAQEGNPEVKAKRRQMALHLAQKQMLEAVPTADVVVTNPTHYAIAMKYERGKDKAPVILAKGENLFAQRIKKIAKEHDVPTVENKPVARILFRVGRVGEAIPSELYQVVAEILTYVYRTHRYYFHQLKIRRLKQG